MPYGAECPRVAIISPCRLRADRQEGKTGKITARLGSNSQADTAGTYSIVEDRVKKQKTKVALMPCVCLYCRSPRGSKTQTLLHMDTKTHTHSRRHILYTHTLKQPLHWCLPAMATCIIYDKYCSLFCRDGVSALQAVLMIMLTTPHKINQSMEY